MKLLRLIGGSALAAASITTATAIGFVEKSTNVTADETWTNENVYILTRAIFVRDGATLTIEPGTIVRGVEAAADGSDLAEEPGALIITRGSRLVAEGTPELPVIMTGIDDPNVPGGAGTIPDSYTNSQGNTKTNGANYGFNDYSPDGPSGDNAFAYVGRWGGLVVLGEAFVAQGTQGLSFPYTAGDLVTPASLNDPAAVGQDFIEGIEPGIVPGAGAPDNLGVYGGVDDNDDSGTITFLQIRYAGFTIGPNNELNSFTSGGLGGDTVLEFVESSFNEDDGFEFFGGTNDARHLHSNYISDDSFDGDEGFRGDLQFISAIQGSLTAARSGWGQNNDNPGPLGSNPYDFGIEFDGPEPNNQGGVPNTNLRVWNGTFILSASEEAFILKESADGAINNVSVTFFDGDNEVWDDDATVGTVGSFNLYTTASTFDKIGGVITDGPPAAQLGEPQMFRGADPYGFQGLDPRLDPASNASGSTGPLPPAGLVQVNYSGYQRENSFLHGWSYVSRLGVLDPAAQVARPNPVVGTNGTNATVSFVSAGAGVTYVVERQVDGRNWVPAGTISGAGTLTFVDAGNPLTPGAPVDYRVYAL